MRIKILRNVFIRHNELIKDRQSVWFLHGFADSGTVYRDVFDSGLGSAFNIYVVDLPGFGVSPWNQKYPSMKEQATLLHEIMREEIGDVARTNIVAHSIGALIGTWVCQWLGDQINYYINTEGNLTEADSYFSGKPLEFATPEAFKESFKKEIFELALIRDCFKHYYSNVCMAAPLGLWSWGYTSQEHVKDSQCGIAFKQLRCNKIYIWGDVDTPLETRRFIADQQLPNKLYEGVGHWHMIENATRFYTAIQTLMKES